MKKILLVLLSLILCITCFTGCAKKDDRTDDIVVLFTNDIHCGIEDNTTLAGVSYYKKLMETKSKYVTLVDCGDAIQGSYLGAISKGDVIIDAMNLLDFEYAILGNHEFDYGMEKLKSLIDKANAKYLACNITYSGKGENLLKDLKPYDIKTYGKTKVAFIGVSTPNSLVSSTPANFMEDDEYVYGFPTIGGDPQEFYDAVQKNVDAARAEGVDYVVVLGHLGIGVEDEVNSPYTSIKTVQNTTGIDVLLDGHSHSTFTYFCQKNKEGKNTIVAQTGTKLANLGQLVISKDGTITVSNISDIKDKDEEVANKISEMSEYYEKMLDIKIGSTNVDLTITDDYGVRIVRTRETNLGDLVADSFRKAADSDIAYQNGGGVRETIKAGDITYKSIISVLPFGNMLCKVALSGQDVVDMFEYFVKDVQKEYVEADHKTTIGEQGSFPQVSGIKFDVDTSIPSPAIVDSLDNLVSIGEGRRRLSNVMVLENDEYVPIDLNKTYTLALLDYPAKNGGCGLGTFMKDKTILLDGTIADYEALCNYIEETLNGNTSSYRKPQGRITIK